MLQQVRLSTHNKISPTILKKFFVANSKDHAVDSLWQSNDDAFILSREFTFVRSIFGASKCVHARSMPHLLQPLQLLLDVMHCPTLSFTWHLASENLKKMLALEVSLPRRATLLAPLEMNQQCFYHAVVKAENLL